MGGNGNARWRTRVAYIWGLPVAKERGCVDIMEVCWRIGGGLTAWLCAGGELEICWCAGGRFGDKLVCQGGGGGVRWWGIGVYTVRCGGTGGTGGTGVFTKVFDSECGLRTRGTRGTGQISKVFDSR